MRIQRGLVSGTTVALLLVFGANILRAQSLSAASGASIQSGSHQQFRAASFAKPSGAPADAFVSELNAPLPPPSQISRRKAIVLGIVIGGAVGATAGYFIAHDSCESCNDSGPVALASSLGAFGGAALGGFVAAQNSPPDVSRSSARSVTLRSAATPFSGRPYPVVRFRVAGFR